ncbi:sugar ABC transporter substrate-binding protein [Alkalihalobacillus sp. MEB130]|uniref:sugar ABC transporter substrate-binding protein n=1 Tax=Alkalihalobacillus sp. MEB130 TaxID=2976704 RepID=UPI0028DEC76E|nr:sugar ABC transporter substrate-binding protein [Alkalihalobacillus sp. MEB130]MDT8859247.1 sugar ABC transporter substrate-binding protein [Alkalihalobacillus sp. MEB130]
MRVNKKVFLMILSLVMVIMLAACGGGEGASSEGSSGDKKVIGVSLSSVSDTFRTFIYDAMNEEASNHPDFEFVFSDAQEDSSRQMNQVENFITRGVDAIIFMPVDTVAAPDIVSKVNEASIPIIVVNQTFDAVDQATAFVGSSSIESGLLQMEEVAKQLDGKGSIAIIDGMLGHEAQIKRTEGNMEIIEQNPDMEVVLQGTGEWSRNQGMNLMENWLQAGKQIDAVVANNDEMAIGALLAIEAAGKLDEIVVAGIDASPDALELLQAGKLDVTVFQDATGQASTSVQLAVKAANGEEVETVMIPFQLVTPDNVDEFIGEN